MECRWCSYVQIQQRRIRVLYHRKLYDQATERPGSQYGPEDYRLRGATGKCNALWRVI